MKPHKIVLFFLALFALMFACWYFFPAEGVDVGGVKLRFPSYEKALEDLRNGDSAVDVDSVLLAVQKSYEMVREQGDTLAFYKEYGLELKDWLLHYEGYLRLPPHFL